MWGWRVREGKSISKSGRRDRWTSDYKLCAESRSVWFILFDPVSFIRVFPLSISDDSGINTSIVFFLKKNCLLFLHEPTCLTCKKLGFILFHFQVVKPSAYDLHLGSFRSSCLQLSLTNASSRKVTNPLPFEFFFPPPYLSTPPTSKCHPANKTWQRGRRREIFYFFTSFHTVQQLCSRLSLLLLVTGITYFRQ